LEKEDVKSVIDQRKGQKHDYRFTPEVKGQLIEQFVIEVVSNRPTGGDRLTKIMKERCQLNLSAGSINSHLLKLGLSNIKDSLYEYFVESKKKILRLLRKETSSKNLEQALNSSLKAPFTIFVFRLQLLILLQHRVKYFLQICDPDFFPKMEKIINVYQKYYNNLYCFDECTGLQALERTAPRLPANDNCPEYHEPEYIRHGTVSILSILHVASGKVFTNCIPDHKSSTIVLSLKKHILHTT
ncbi:transposase, partial [Candidatus Magnetomorum sp. HK-1]